MIKYFWLKVQHEKIRNDYSISGLICTLVRLYFLYGCVLLGFKLKKSTSTRQYVQNIIYASAVHLWANPRQDEEPSL
jgi:hypothetical protein